jgi:phosphoribosyl 1,2-cyclic phosphodiesterase
MTATFTTDGGAVAWRGDGPRGNTMTVPMNVTFHGVRGSTPCSDRRYLRYGGNTSCVTVESAGFEPIVFDLGTGLRPYGESLGGIAAQPWRGTSLVTHFHWDHIQGLPFFAPLIKPGAAVQVFAPSPVSGGTACDAFRSFICDPLFPVTIDDLPCDIVVNDTGNDRFEASGAVITSRFVPHAGKTLGFRVERSGRSVVYISDHQQPADGSFDIADEVLELAADADLLIHDAQYTPSQFAVKSTWGHSTIEYACHVAKRAGVKTLALFHHDPSHDDDTLDAMGDCARRWGDAVGVEVITAAENMTVSLAARVPARS